MESHNNRPPDQSRLTLKQANQVIAACHAILDRAGVPSAVGIPCDDPECNSQLTHRLKQLLASMKSETKEAS